MRQLKILSIIFICMGLYIQSYAQKYNFKQYSVSDGLPHSQVSTIVQDHNNFIWFGTFGGGLAKFNGFEFKTYTRRDGLRDNVVNTIFEDSNENLWVATDMGGVARLEDDSLRYQFRKSPLDTTTVFKIKESPDGRIWFGTYGAGVFIYDGSSLNQLTIESGLSSNFIWNFWFDDDGKVWIGTHYGISIYDLQETSEKNKISTYTDESRIGGYAIYDFHKDSRGRLWIATNNGVTTYKQGQFKTVRRINEQKLGYVYSITEDKEGNIWLGTAENGIFRQLENGSFIQMKEKNGLSSNLIYYLYKDRNNRIWAATQEAGVNLYKGDQFIRYTNENGFAPESVLSVKHAGDNELWVGTDSRGLWKISGSNETFQSKQIALEGRDIWVIEELANGHLLLLMGDNSILEYDGKSFVNYNEKKELPVSYTIDLFIDSRDRVWIGTGEGIILVNGDRVRRYSKKDGLADDFIWEVTEDHEGRIWISTNNGLSIFNEESFMSYTLKKGLVQDIVSMVIQDESLNYWIGTSGGISYLNHKDFNRDNKFVNFDADGGMPRVNINSLITDANGNLWQGTSSGIQKLDIQHFLETGTKNIVRYTLGDNNTGLEFAHKAADRDLRDNIWLGTTNGLLNISPLEEVANISEPTAYINNIQVNFNDADESKFHKEHGIITSDSTEAVSLEYDSNNLTFNFSSIEFENPEQVSFRYRLLGFDKRWSAPDKIRSAIFTNLSAKEYQFEVQAKGKNGMWGKRASFNFTITPPFWETYWFYGLMIAAVGGLVYGYIRFQVHFFEKKRLKELVDDQTKDLNSALKEKEVLIKEIHHRVKNNLAVISGLLELQMDYSNEDFTVRALTESQRRIQSIAMIHEKLYQNENLSEIDFQQYVEELLAIISYSSNLESKEIELNSTIDNINLSIEQAIPCGLILNELVSNAYEHAFNSQQDGNISIRFLEDGDEIRFSVSDDGGGLPEDIDSKKNDSLGITLVETLTMQLQGNLDVQSSDSGTEFAITFEKEKVENDILSHS